MLDKLLQQLQQSVHLEETDDLPRTFSLISEEMNRLKSAYSKLQENFLAVNEELGKKVAELNRLAYLLNTILKNISEAIFFIDLEGMLVMMNDAGSKMLNLKAESALLRKIWDLFPDDFFGFSMKEALKFGISQKLLYKTIFSKELEISTTFSYDGPKSCHGLIMLLRDVSDKKQAQLIAHRTDRMRELGEMAATVAHEIRNPLGGIRGYASLLYRDLSEEKHLQEMAHFIVEGTKRLENLVITILQYARPLQLHPESVDLGALLRALIQFVKIDPAFPPHVRIIPHIPHEPLLAPVDGEALRSALLNLIFNAFEAMPYGGSVTLSMLKQINCCQISLSDTGIGMEEEMLQQLFSPFFTTKQKGTGIGLVETKKIIQAHGGTIEVRSSVGKGSTFTITLPLRRP
jgi:signal transduction histidine kinase